MNELIENWLAALTRQYHETRVVFHDGSPAVPSYIYYAILEGKKFYKVVYLTTFDEDFRGFPNRFVQPSDLVNRHCTVHAFVDKVTGDVYKPATWRAPAKIVRFNLLNEQSYNNMITTCDWAGSYLYLQ